MKPGTLRRLTEGETALATAVFGSALALERVRIFALPVWRRPFAAGPALVFWPAFGALQDFSLARLSLQGVLIHELTHVWQAQQGINLLTGKIRAGDHPASYRYPVGNDCDWSGLNIEQQAMVVQHRFLELRGINAPPEHAHFDRLCPLAKRMEI
jgi:hypothetical protein